MGKTRRDPETRIREHMRGDGYGNPPKPWTDTVIRWVVIYRSSWVTTGGLALREWVNIVARRPLYNVVWNRGNGRRVAPWVARRQRARRDVRSWRVAGR